jgi:hypothetical protein
MQNRSNSATAKPALGVDAAGAGFVLSAYLRELLTPVITRRLLKFASEFAVICES